MAKWGKCDYKQFKTLQKQMKKLQKNDFEEFCEQCAKELAARLLAKVIKRTPVGKYPKSTGKKGGTLRRGWTSQSNGSGSEGMKVKGVSQFVDTLKVHRYGNIYVVEISNSVNYASYVEFGHRTRNHKGWVNGRFMLTISEKELETQAPKIIERKLKKFLGECLDA